MDDETLCALLSAALCRLHPAGVDREDGQPIVKDGPLKLVNTEDKRPARWVRNLASIQMSSIP